MTPDRIRTFRESLGLSQAEFGRLMGSTATDPARNVRRWENAETDAPGWVILLIDMSEASSASRAMIERAAKKMPN